MGLLKFFDTKPDETPIEANGVTPTPASGVESTSLPDSAASRIIGERKQRADAGKPRGPRGAKLSAEAQEMAKAFDALYAPETWEGVVCAPADTMLALSGKQLWNISDKERKTLSTHASITARCFAVENPKWLALTMLSISIIQVYGSRASLHMIERAKEKKAEAMKAKAPDSNASE